MNFDYKAFLDDDHRTIDEYAEHDTRKIKEMVTINITVEVEKSKYEAKKAKYAESIPKKIAKLFK